MNNLVKDNYACNNKGNKLSSFESYIKFKETFNELNKKFHDKFQNKKFNLYPYGSKAKLSWTSSSDLVCFLQINTDNKDEIKSFFEEINNFIKKEIDNSSNLTLSNRLLIISFNYNGIEIDLNVVGLSPFWHSELFRIYNLLDPRFTMLVLCIKLIIKEIGLKATTNESIFLNAFSWEMLIKAFLQDII